MKKWIAIVLLFAVFCGLLAGCRSKDLSAEGAYQVVLEELGDLAQYATDPHIHEGTYDGKPCFNVYITVNGLSMQYVVSQSGKILHEGASEHSH